MELLPQFNELAKCEKCGCDKVNTFHCKGRYPSKACWDGYYDYFRKSSPIAKQLEEEHLHRVCTRCHYEWFEAVLEGAQA